MSIQPMKSVTGKDPSLIDRQVLFCLRRESGADRVAGLSKLRAQAPEATLAAIVKALNHDEKRTRRRAGTTLPFFSALSRAGVTVERHATELAAYLAEGKDERVRLSCAIALMPLSGPKVDDAFMQALADPFESVVQIASVEVGARKVRGSLRALRSTLKHPSWRVRLEACKALILRKQAGPMVIAALKQLKREPEASVYDLECSEFRDLEASLHKAVIADMSRLLQLPQPPAETRPVAQSFWENLDSILARALNQRKSGMEARMAFGRWHRSSRIRRRQIAMNTQVPKP